MSVYDPFGQGYTYDWRLEEAVKQGVRRALDGILDKIKEQKIVYIQKGDGEKDRATFTFAEVQMMVDQARREVVSALEERIIELTKENIMLKERIRELEEKQNV